MFQLLIRRLLIVFLLFPVLGGQYFSQANVGDDLFANFEYQQATKYYTQSQSLTLNQKENLAFCYYQLHDYENAERLYLEILGTDDVEPLFYELYAVCLSANGKYQEAKTNFEKALSLDSSLLASKVGLKSLAALPEIVSREQVLEVTNPVGLNDATAAYGVRWYKQGVLFSAEVSRDSVKKRKGIEVDEEYSATDQLAYGLSKRPVSSLFYAEMTGFEVASINSLTGVDDFHIGAFYLDGDTLYFTHTDALKGWSANQNVHPRLYSGIIKNGELEETKRLKVKKLSDDAGAGHPFLNLENGKLVLYFSSDRSGGYGGSDLYKSTKTDDGKWSEPENLGASVNSEGDELFPSIYGEDLYFSSNGHAGLGGMDLYKLPLSNLQGVLELLPMPLNSFGDDLSIIFEDGDDQTGYLVSNRFGGKGDDDVYLFRLKLEGFFVRGVVKDLNGNPVEGALVKLYNDKGEEVGQVKTDKKGRYLLSAEEEGEYELIATIPGYGDRESISMNTERDSYEQVNLTLEPELTAQGAVKHEDGSVASNVDVELRDESGKVIFKGKTDENGYYQFLLEEDQSYEIGAREGNLSAQTTIETSEDYDTNANEDLILKAGTYVDGVLLDENGNPMVGVEVKLYDDQGNLLATTVSDENGQFHFDLDRNENYQISAETEGMQGLANIYTGEKFDSNDQLDLNMEPIGRESFALVEDNDSQQGIENVRVVLVDNETGNKFVTTTDSEGKFTVRIKPKHNYTINLEKDGYYPKSIGIKAGKLPEKVDLNKMGDFGMDYAGFEVKKIYFELDKHELTEASKDHLQQIVEIMKVNPNADIVVRSYADCRGSKKYNDALTAKRSKAVKNYLVAKGISSKRIKTEALGASNFVNNCITDDACNEDEHAQNRRSEFEINFNK